MVVFVLRVRVKLRFGDAKVDLCWLGMGCVGEVDRVGLVALAGLELVVLVELAVLVALADLELVVLAELAVLAEIADLVALVVLHTSAV